MSERAREWEVVSQYYSIKGRGVSYALCISDSKRSHRPACHRVIVLAVGSPSTELETSSSVDDVVWNVSCALVGVVAAAGDVLRVERETENGRNVAAAVGSKMRDVAAGILLSRDFRRRDDAMVADMMDGWLVYAMWPYNDNCVHLLSCNIRVTTLQEIPAPGRPEAPSAIDRRKTKGAKEKRRAISLVGWCGYWFQVGLPNILYGIPAFSTTSLRLLGSKVPTVHGREGLSMTRRDFMAATLLPFDYMMNILLPRLLMAFPGGLFTL